MPLPVESSDTQFTGINEAAREERVKLQVYTVGNRSRLSKNGKTLYKEASITVIKILASRLPSPSKGRDEARASGLSSTVKDECKEWAGKKV